MRTYISKRGISTERTVEREQGVATIQFTFSTTWDETMAVKLVDPLPTSVSSSDIGVGERGCWTLQNSNEVVWSGKLLPETDLEVEYGVRIPDSTTLEELDVTPRIDAVQPVPPDAEAPLWRSASEQQLTTSISTITTDSHADRPGRRTDETGETDAEQTANRESLESTVDRYRLDVVIDSNRDPTVGETVVHGLANGVSVVDTSPSVDEIRTGSVEGPVEFVVESPLEQRLLVDALDSIDGVESVSVTVLEPDVDGGVWESNPAVTHRMFEHLRETTDRVDHPSLERELAETSFDPERESDPAPETLEPISIADLVGDEQLPDGGGSFEYDGRDSHDGPDGHDDHTATTGDDEDSRPIDQQLVDTLEEATGHERAAAVRAVLGLESFTSLEARVEHLQRRTETVLAYEEALGQFLDEYGDGETVDALAERLERTRQEVATLDGDLERVTQKNRIRDARLRSLTEDVSTLEGDVDELRTDVAEDVDDRLSELEAQLADTRSTLEAELDALEAELEAVSEWRERLTNAF